MSHTTEDAISSSHYTLHLAGLTRELPIVRVSEHLRIASFVILGDAELVVAAARALADKLPQDIDCLMTAEAKGIPLAQELSRILGLKHYVVARKSKKPYMVNPLCVSVNSITTQKTQTLYLDKSDYEYIQNARVVLIDDVISTGESLEGIDLLAEKVGAQVIARAALLAEGSASDRDDIIYLEKLPLFED